MQGIFNNINRKLFFLKDNFGLNIKKIFFKKDNFKF